MTHAVLAGGAGRIGEEAARDGLRNDALSQTGMPVPSVLWSEWRRLLDLQPSPGEDLHTALLSRFVGTVRIEDRDALAAAAGRPVLFLANHQTMVESSLFMTIASGLLGCITSAVAHVQHLESWQGWLLRHHLAYLGIPDPGLMFFFDDHDQRMFMRRFDDVRQFLTARRRSLLVHVDGTRVQTCRHLVSDCSGVFVRLAIALGMPIVPVRFKGGLPVDSMDRCFDFPLGYARQDHWIGRPLSPAMLAPLEPEERRDLILDRLNRLGGEVIEERPNPGDPAFAAAVERERWGVPVARAVIACALAGLPEPHPEIAALNEGLRRGRLSVADTATGRWLAALGTWLTGGGLAIDVRPG